MKKFLMSGLLAVGMLFAVTACGEDTVPAAQVPEAVIVEDATPVTLPEVIDVEEAEADEAGAIIPQMVTVTYHDAERNPHQVSLMQMPTSVAIFDWSILDILYTVGWEKTGIETLILPATATLPTEVSWFENQDFVIRGGTLHYVNWDVLDLVQPELVILGMRSFAHNAAGETTSPEVRAELRQQAEADNPNTAFIRLSHSSARSELLADTSHNVYVLQQIFPQIADELQAYLDRIVEDLNYIQTRVQASDMTAQFVMIWADRMSLFLPEGRFHMIHDEFGFTPAVYEQPQWAADQHGFDSRAEFLLSADPDIIFLLDRTDMVSPTGGVGVQNFMADSIIQNTSAYQNGHIYVLEGNAWYTVTGGFSAIDTKIANIMAFVNTLE
ncbi:MAG: ABC transporter substrate-binding protein [Defluviitaleaceae bacterium]|nr:ABC transporter substrate-binding protein [Defluviitaleaceae bacterium]